MTWEDLLGNIPAGKDPILKIPWIETPSTSSSSGNAGEQVRDLAKELESADEMRKQAILAQIRNLSSAKITARHTETLADLQSPMGVPQMQVGSDTRAGQQLLDRATFIDQHRVQTMVIHAFNALAHVLSHGAGVLTTEVVFSGDRAGDAIETVADAIENNRQTIEKMGRVLQIGGLLAATAVGKAVDFAAGQLTRSGDNQVTNQPPVDTDLTDSRPVEPRVSIFGAIRNTRAEMREETDLIRADREKVRQQRIADKEALRQARAIERASASNNGSQSRVDGRIKKSNGKIYPDALSQSLGESGSPVGTYPDLAVGSYSTPIEDNQQMSEIENHLGAGTRDSGNRQRTNRKPAKAKPSQGDQDWSADTKRPKLNLPKLPNLHAILPQLADAQVNPEPERSIELPGTRVSAPPPPQPETGAKVTPGRMWRDLQVAFGQMEDKSDKLSPAHAEKLAAQFGQFQSPRDLADPRNLVRAWRLTREVKSLPGGDAWEEKAEMVLPDGRKIK
ncbi:MAG: hypothetical protein AAB874_02440 [Patescibacteria group bacterium]